MTRSFDELSRYLQDLDSARRPPMIGASDADLASARAAFPAVHGDLVRSWELWGGAPANGPFWLAGDALTDLRAILGDYARRAGEEAAGDVSDRLPAGAVPVAVAGLHPLWLVADCDGRIFTPGSYDGHENRWDAGLIMVGERWLNICWQRAFLAFEVLAPRRVAVGVGCFGETARWVRGYLEGVGGRFAKYPLTDSLGFSGEMGRACKFLGHPESGLVLSAPASDRRRSGRWRDASKRR